MPNGVRLPVNDLPHCCHGVPLSTAAISRDGPHTILRIEVFFEGASAPPLAIQATERCSS
jgi:hypothetical protein